MNKFKANMAESHKQEAVSSEKGLSALLAGDILDYKSLSARERENLYHACCWLCAGLIRCNQKKYCSTECCKGINSAKSIQDDHDSMPSLYQKKNFIEVALLFHPEIMSKLDSDS